MVETALVVKPKHDTICYEILKWPSKKAGAERLMNELARHKATLSLGLNVYALYVYYLCVSSFVPILGFANSNGYNRQEARNFQDEI